MKVLVYESPRNHVTGMDYDSDKPKTNSSMTWRMRQEIRKIVITPKDTRSVRNYRVVILSMEMSGTNPKMITVAMPHQVGTPICWCVLNDNYT